MGAVKLELRCPKNINGVAVDPQPNWSLDSLTSELNSLQLNASSLRHVPFTKSRIRELPGSKGTSTSSKAFVMHVDELEDTESEGEEIHDQSLAVGRRFSCNELYLSDSDDFEDEPAVEETRILLMDKLGLLEGALFEFDREHTAGVKEEIRNTLSALQTDLMSDSERSIAALIQIEKFKEARREMDRKLDTQYQRKIAEALDNHLIAVQRDYEHRSQIEERRIRNDAAFEESKKREKALQEERVRQERTKAEAEAARKRSEEAQKAALEAERRATKEAAERKATATRKQLAAQVVQTEVTDLRKDESGEALQSKQLGLSGCSEVQLIGNVVKGAESALKAEAERLRKYKELDEKNEALKLASNKDFRSYEMQIARNIKQITGFKENVRMKADELIKIFNDPSCPQSISFGVFAKKVVSQCEKPVAIAATFGCAHVIVLVTKHVPFVMDLVLAEFHRACIYTVPKHIHYSESAFRSKEAYYKMIGYREEGGKIESTEQFLERIASYMKLYGAVVQTEVGGVQNMLKEGWAWLARFLNVLPANIYTAVALYAFLQMAGFALFRKYKSQFRKILNIIHGQFLDALESSRDPMLNSVIQRIKQYIETKQVLHEPEGWRLQTSLLSETFVPESDTGYHHEQHYRHTNQYMYKY
ncbi:protein GLE1 isoform X2 [Telopea speciosissima]|uniref:protein GLE1 isoform X2 n=1 Tax=Telopea speciosissima TaxID=54955 RepID=UPI001CC39188|nr:protein GLE1 isoform X2 [Telopea speciosissima]